MHDVTNQTEVRPPRDAAEWRTASWLVDEYVDWLRAATGLEPFDEQPDFAVEVADLRACYARADRDLFLAWTNGTPLGIAAVRRHPDGSAELKRMYVRDTARGSGVADHLVQHAIETASAHGCDRLWLETLRGVMDRAVTVYGRNGFRQDADIGRTIALDAIMVMSRPLGHP